MMDIEDEQREMDIEEQQREMDIEEQQREMDIEQKKEKKGKSLKTAKRDGLNSCLSSLSRQLVSQLFILKFIDMQVMLMTNIQILVQIILEDICEPYGLPASILEKKYAQKFQSLIKEKREGKETKNHTSNTIDDKYIESMLYLRGNQKQMRESHIKSIMEEKIKWIMKLNLQEHHKWIEQQFGKDKLEAESLFESRVSLYKKEVQEQWENLASGKKSKMKNLSQKQECLKQIANKVTEVSQYKKSLMQLSKDKIKIEQSYLKQNFRDIFQIKTVIKNHQRRQKQGKRMEQTDDNDFQRTNNRSPIVRPAMNSVLFVITLFCSLFCMTNSIKIEQPSSPSQPKLKLDYNTDKVSDFTVSGLAIYAMYILGLHLIFLLMAMTFFYGCGINGKNGWLWRKQKKEDKK